jgi:hypothetical protein
MALQARWRGVVARHYENIRPQVEDRRNKGIYFLYDRYLAIEVSIFP